VSYPQKLSTGAVDKPTHPGQSLTIKATQRLYLKQYLLHLKAKKDKKNLNTKTALKNGIALLIVILTINQPISANAADPQVELYKLYAHMQVGNDQQYRCLVSLWHKESRWNPKADNKRSSAYGIPQLLKMKERNPYRQIDLGLKYITKRYQTPCLALAYHKKKGHY